MNPTIKQSLFIITGASCVGKSTISEVLFQNETDYIVLESDLLWNDVFNTPENDFRSYRELWMRLCANITQIGKPVVLCGCATPEQFEGCATRNLFNDIHYLAIVCNEDLLEQRMRISRGVTDENWVKSSIDFNCWLKENANLATPNITLLDITTLTPKQAAEVADRWIHERINRG